MKIQNSSYIKNVALAVASIALAAQGAQSQTRQFNAVTGKYTTSNTHIYKHMNTYANSGYYGSNYMVYLNDYNPYAFGGTPSFFSNGGSIYPQGGAVVVGSDGRIYDPDANSVVDPSTSRNNTVTAAPMQLSDRIEAVKLSGNRIRLFWSGDPRPVASMKFSLLDSKRVVLRSTVVTDLPAEAIFTRPSNAVYFRVMITYGDGATRSIVAPL